MPYVRRSPEGRIDSLHRRDEGGLEFLAEDHPEVRAFLAATAGSASPEIERFAALDADFVRVIEDVIDTLIMRNVIAITDLPAEAQTKLFSRKGFRDRVNQQSLKLFGDGETGTV
jgi:hypothetical protein